MKKSLLALAVLGAFAASASAQSSVTIYGTVDLGVSKGNGGTAANPGGNGLSESWQVRQSRASRLGFRGNEDLGGGLSAQFMLEHRFSPDTGANSSAAGTQWDGASYVQLTHKDVGSLYLGRWYTPAFWINLKTDPFGYDGVGVIHTKGLAGFLSTSGVRTNNTVGYKTPSFGGLTLNAAVSAGEGAGGRQTGLNAEYAAGPIYAGIGYEKIKGGATDGHSLVNIGFAYNFGVIRPMAGYARAKVGAPGALVSNDFYSIGATAPVGPGQIKAVYYRFDPANDIQESKFGLGYDYFLSKRTRIYADVGLAKQDGQSNNNAYMVGVRHDF